MELETHFGIAANTYHDLVAKYGGELEF